LGPVHGVVIGLGANLGDPEGQLRAAAVTLFAELGPLQASSLYASAPIGPEQPDFLNAAVLVSWAGPLQELLLLTQAVEARLGRERSIRWGPRHVDLDLLWARGRTASSPELIVPHVELLRRAFALLPLLELCPAAAPPGGGPGYASFLPEVRSQRIQVVRGPDWWKEA
jgi:2-amino-4-hydroxy-6-hydroxymethyldihydropteridine diphosphokinase